jgi:hypothetical protein
MEMAATMATGAMALALVWIIAGLLSRRIERSIDRSLPDPRWFEA